MSKEKSKILIVDDEPDILEILEYNLKAVGYKVSKAKDGIEALEKAAAIQPDLIILDIMLPGMDGVEVCSRIRQNPDLDHCIVAFLTARGEEFTEIASLEVGGDDFIQKPIKPKVLLSRIKALLRRAKKLQTSDNEILEYKDIKLDQEKFLIWVDSEKIDLPRKEFYILKLLLSNPGRVYERAEIYNKIWGPNIIVGSRTIDVHIRKLRERIGEKRIKTIKGVGYKMA